MIIEFLGLPGSGKTTYFRALRKKRGKNLDYFLTQDDLLEHSFLQSIKKRNIGKRLILKIAKFDIFKKFLLAYGKSFDEIDQSNSFIIENSELHNFIIDETNKLIFDQKEKGRILSLFIKNYAIARLLTFNKFESKTNIIDEGFIHRIIHSGEGTKLMILKK